MSEIIENTDIRGLLRTFIPNVYSKDARVQLFNFIIASMYPLFTKVYNDREDLNNVQVAFPNRVGLQTKLNTFLGTVPKERVLLLESNDFNIIVKPAIEEIDGVDTDILPNGISKEEFEEQCNRVLSRHIYFIQKITFNYTNNG